MFEVVRHVPVSTRNTEVLQVPEYASLSVRTTYEHVFATLPEYLRGEPGLVRLIADFVGHQTSWIQIRCDPVTMLQKRDRDLYFVYYALTMRLPLSTSLTAAADLHVPSRRPKIHHLRTPDVYTHPLPLRDGVYYTRNGHIGTQAELQDGSEEVECRGYVLSSPPRPEQARDMVLVTSRHRARLWTGFGQVVTLEDLFTYGDSAYAYPTIVIDGPAVTSTQTMIHAYPDGRHLSGTISDALHAIDRAYASRQSTIYIHPTMTVSDQYVIDCLFLFQVSHGDHRLITGAFTHCRTKLIQVAETLFLQGVLLGM